jgi:hypothetical protein
VHQGRHPVDEAAEVVVEGDHVVGDEAKRRVAVLADLAEREAAPSLCLGFGLRIPGRLVAVLVVVIVLVVMVMLAHGDAV